MGADSPMLGCLSADSLTYHHLCSIHRRPASAPPSKQPHFGRMIKAADLAMCSIGAFFVADAVAANVEVPLIDIPMLQPDAQKSGLDTFFPGLLNPQNRSILCRFVLWS